MAQPRQLLIFGPSINPVTCLKTSMRQTLKDSRWSREQVVDRMNEIAAREKLKVGRAARITVALLDAWVAESKGNVIPLGLLPVFCVAAESLSALEVLAACCQAKVVGERDARILEAAKLDLAVKRLSTRRRKLQREILEEDYGS